MFNSGFNDEDILEYIGYQLYGGGTDPYFSDYVTTDTLTIDAFEFFDFLDRKEEAARKKEELKRKIFVIIHYDVGFGNKLYIRGDTSPLSWRSGRECKNLDANTWTFEMDCGYSSSVEFKVLINDSTWETGYNHKVKVGNMIEIQPSF